MKNNWLKNRIVIISGASGGLGFGIAKRLIEKYDCKIIGIARNQEKIKRAVCSLGEKSSNFEYRIFDVNDINGWKNLKEELEKKNITPDIMINNAGFMLPFAKFEKYSDREISEIIGTNFTAHVNAVKFLFPLLKKSSCPAIINISSAAGLCAVVGQSMYSATKFAMRGFTESLIQEYKKQIYICGVYPGFIKTDILARMSVSDKENKLINRMMMPADKAVKKIVHGIAKKKKRIVMGLDGRAMSFFSRIFPSFTPSAVTSVLKKSGLDLFSEVFD